MAAQTPSSRSSWRIPSRPSQTRHARHPPLSCSLSPALCTVAPITSFSSVADRRTLWCSHPTGFCQPHGHMATATGPSLQSSLRLIAAHVLPHAGHPWSHGAPCVVRGMCRVALCLPPLYRAIVWTPGRMLQVRRVGESLITIGGGPVWGPEGLTQAQLDRALQQVTAGMERQGIAASIIRTRALPNASKEDAGAAFLEWFSCTGPACWAQKREQGRGGTAHYRAPLNWPYPSMHSPLLSNKCQLARPTGLAPMSSVCRVPPQVSSPDLEHDLACRRAEHGHPGPQACHRGRLLHGDPGGCDRERGLWQVDHGGGADQVWCGARKLISGAMPDS